MLRLPFVALIILFLYRLPVYGQDSCWTHFGSRVEISEGKAAQTFNEVYQRIGGEIRMFGHGVVDEIQWIPPNSSEPKGAILVEPNQAGTHLVYAVETQSNFLGIGVNKMLLARVILSYPNLKSIEGELKWTNHEVYQKARKRGLSKYDAVKETPFYKSATSIGFSKISQTSEIPDDPNKFVNLIVEKE